MKKIPSISSAVNESYLRILIGKNYNTLSPIFFRFVSDWLIGAYSNFKDIDTYIILIYLVNNDFKFYRENNVLIDFESFYKDKTLEIEEIKIIKIAKDLLIPKESARRKVAELEKRGVIKRKNKKIFIDRSAYETVKPIKSLRHLSLLISISSKILVNENKIDKFYNPDEVSKKIKEQFSFCWYQFYKFIFAYYIRWKKMFKDYELVCIGLLVFANAATNKSFGLKKLTAKKWVEEISEADSVGLNAMSISDITGIPRPTVVRKLNKLIKAGWMNYNEKKLISVDLSRETSIRGKKEQEKTLDMLSELILRVLNQIKIN
ncbi:MarR family transcriptional regulator [Candidatus Pelagibacter sp. HIMB1748]|uniref:MarR family transcriptional regulator n=1 Tax=unclassified Candidatus Pelagibacter TaxID=2647897 RepID=UPI003F8565E2